MIDAQLDTLDYQARNSTRYIMANVEKGLESALKVIYKTQSQRDRMSKMMKNAFDLFKEWDYKFELETVPASLYLAFELSFATYFQETKIDDADVRRGLHGNVIIENFFYLEIHRWAALDSESAK